MSKIKLPERVLPPVFGHQMQIEWFRKLTWRERIKIALGYSIVCRVDVNCQHKPGQFAPMPRVWITKELTSEKLKIDKIKDAYGITPND